MKNILIASFDMEVGGVERSLVSMLDHFDYKQYAIDLMLYKHQGDFMNLISHKANLLGEIPQYSTFRKSIAKTLQDRQYTIGFSRILSKVHADILGRVRQVAEPGYYQMQLMWKYALPYLPKVEKEYDAAISYLWPHYFIAEKIKAKKKIAWIHTDYSNVETNVKLDLEMWRKFDHIIAVSNACKDSFLAKYRELESKVVVIENITSPDFIRNMAEKEAAIPMVNDERFKIMTVSRLSHAKGIDNAVKALRILKDKGYKDIAWYIVGYGGDEAAIKELIAMNGLDDQFILLGKKTNPYPYIKACDLYVQPSRYEGKAVTVTEAKILGRPILITNYSTAKSQVEDGYDGIICELSVDGIAGGIERLYKKHELRNDISNHNSNQEFSNTYELDKLYGVI
ncbi:glycosyltransferase [Paenibacillus alginolyticus]|uniref:Glycosyltransferase n=1 Tax=Paenibacillus alginolyticus TaxID=59839 RepID=A0ABT4G8W2_9BACL|nr:glycosyltransferase [Paenibacillus alginolyticus]MCY9692625.1 glycosyltransferase [Paenibacillus alginolyticus]MEC0143832.1 glycosyltransferase [Paenibacillus alginolyticus]